MELKLRGVVVVTGHYGCGKSEISVNLAVHHRRMGLRVALADLDVVNPYFRSREAAERLERLGIEVVLPPPGLAQSELPAVSPAVAGLIRRSVDLAVLDAGGDPVGARVLASLGEAFKFRRPAVLMVVNPFRPETSTVSRCLGLLRAIEASCRLTVTGLAGNAHLLAETGPREILAGRRFLAELAEASARPIAFHAVAEELLERLDPSVRPEPVLPLRRQLVPPWETARRWEDLEGEGSS